MQTVITNKTGILSNPAVEEKIKKAGKVVVLSNENDTYSFLDVSRILNIGKSIDFISVSNEIEIAFNLGKIYANKKETDEIDIVLPNDNKLATAINKLIKTCSGNIENKPVRKKRTSKKDMEEKVTKKVAKEPQSADFSNNNMISQPDKKTEKIKPVKEKEEIKPEKATGNKKTITDNNEAKQENIIADTNYYTKLLSKYIEYDESSNLEKEIFYKEIAECFKVDNKDIVQYGMIKSRFDKNIANKIIEQITPKIRLIQGICRE